MKPAMHFPKETSFHGVTISTTLNDLTKVCGEPDWCGGEDDKVQYEWAMELKDGTFFTIYDWKEYQTILPDELINWHIGSITGEDSRKALSALRNNL